ncbi:MAG: hypothetical protein ACREVX_00115 [Clostridium sp.]|uniref:hypothetical protein n=1 Tax=Clostridium sp. TaxID=1506 RepID=UPI003D6CB2AA
MAKDRLVLFIQGVDINEVKQLYKFRRVQNDNTYYIKRYGMNLANDDIHIGYNMINNDRGDIRLSLNVPYLSFKYGMHGVETTTNGFLDILAKAIIDFIDLDKISDSHSIKISIDETNLDIILPQQQIEQMLNLLSKTQVPRMKVDNRLLDKGTVYFYSGNNIDNPGFKIRIYDKTKELREKGKDINELKLEGNGLLRIEHSYRRRKTCRELKKQDYLIRLRNSPIVLGTTNTKIQQDAKTSVNRYDNIFKLVKMNQYKDNRYVNNHNKYSKGITEYVKLWGDSNEEQVKIAFVSSQLIVLQRQNNLRELGSILSAGYQSELRDTLIQVLHLDKKVLTRAGLMNCIDNNAKLSPNAKKTARRIVRYLNKEIETISVSQSTLDKYKKLILSQGYHYIYSKDEIEPQNYTYDSEMNQVNNINEFINVKDDSKSIQEEQEKIVSMVK